ncbi:MAG: exonuclease SbcCD subunit D [Nitrospinota bacterium]
MASRAGEPVRFLHTADLHLGRSFSGLGNPRATLRQEDLRGVLRRLKDLALEEGVNLFLISGDLFDHPCPRPHELEVAEEVFRELHSGGTRTFIIPGNHDYLAPGSVWQSHFGEGYPPARVFLSREVCHMDDLALSIAGIPFDRALPEARPLKDLPPRLFPRYPRSILLCHGSLEGVPGDLEAPLSREEVEALPFNYVALGHYHRSDLVFESSHKAAAYPGSPETLSFHERNLGERVTLLGELSPEGGVSIRKVTLDGRRAEVLELDLTAFEDEVKLREALRERAGEGTMLKLKLKGSPTLRILKEAESLEERFASSFFHLEVDLRDLFPPSDLSLDPRFISGRFCLKLKERISRAGEEEGAGLARAALRLGLRALREVERP